MTTPVTGAVPSLTSTPLAGPSPKADAMGKDAFLKLLVAQL